jgi:geranylgeranyl diphosphate synthase type II
MNDSHENAPDDVVALYRNSLPVLAREPRLRGVMSDMLEAPGSLVRLRLGLLAGKLLGLPTGSARSLATAFEYFHTASLLLDDLPCMDNADERRGRPTAHVTHGEAPALLGALAFINRAYSLLWRSFAGALPMNRNKAAAYAEECLGTAGVLDGQSLDLNFIDTDGSARTAARASLGKTVSLLRLTLVTPAHLAGAEERETVLLDRLAVYWGLAYQIADDFNDLHPNGGSRKTTGRDALQGRPNFILAAGQEAAVIRLDRLMNLVQITFEELLAVRSGWNALAPLIDKLSAAVAIASSAPAYNPLRCA